MSERTDDPTHSEYRWTDHEAELHRQQQEQSTQSGSAGFSYDHTPPRHDYWKKGNIEEIKGYADAEKILTGLIPIGVGLGVGGLGLAGALGAAASAYGVGMLLKNGFSNLQPHNDI